MTGLNQWRVEIDGLDTLSNPHIEQFANSVSVKLHGQKIVTTNCVHISQPRSIFGKTLLQFSNINIFQESLQGEMIYILLVHIMDKSRPEEFSSQHIQFPVVAPSDYC